MSNSFLNTKSVDRKKVLQSLSENICQLNVSVAYDGMQRHGENLVCGTKPSDGTIHNIFAVTIDMACLDGPPVLSIKQLDDLVRKQMFAKLRTVLSTEYEVYLVGPLTNVSKKVTAKMRHIVTVPKETMNFNPGTYSEPDPERRMLFLFYGKPIEGIADMSNKFGGNKLQNDEKIYNTCKSLQSQNSLVFSDSKSDLNDFLVNFSYNNVDSMKSLIRQGAETLVSEGTLDNSTTGKKICPFC